MRTNVCPQGRRISSDKIGMDLLKIIFELKQERDLIGDVIAQFERLAAGRKRRGRLPKWFKEAESQELDKNEADKETGVEGNADAPGEPE